MVKVSFGRPCHVPSCLINEEGGSTYYVSKIVDPTQYLIFIKLIVKLSLRLVSFFYGTSQAKLRESKPICNFPA